MKTVIFPATFVISKLCITQERFQIETLKLWLISAIKRQNRFETPSKQLFDMQ